MVSPGAMITPSPSKSKFGRIGLSRTLSRDKAACEFYKEEEHLVEGDLPSLGAPSIPYTRPSAIHSSDRPDAAIVTPTSRSATPVVKNKSQPQKKGKRLFQRRKEENVTIEAPMLSPETKRKHKVFWSQMDLKDDYTSDDNSVPAVEEEMPDDERRDLTLERRNVSLGKNVEQVEYDAPVTTHDIITILTDMCADCGWTKAKNDPSHLSNGDIKPDYVQKTSRPFDEDVEQDPVDRTKAIFDQDDSYSKYDDESLPSKATMESSSLARSKTAYYTDAYENTAIEVEYYDAGVPDDEVDDDPPPSDGFLQLDDSGDVSAFVRPHDKAMSDINGHSNYANNTGYPISKSKSWAAPDKNAYLQAMARKAKEDFLQKRAEEQQDHIIHESKSLDKGMNSRKKNVRGVASTGSVDLRQDRNMQPNDQGSDVSSRGVDAFKYNYSSPSSVADFPREELSSSFVNDVSMDVSSDIGPRNRLPLGLKKVKSEIPASSSNSAILHGRKSKFNKFGSDSPRRLGTGSNERMDGPYEIESKGSILSLRKKKKVKKGQFIEVDDGSDSEVNKSTDVPPREGNSSIMKDRTGDDIFDFEDSNQAPLINSNAPLSTIKLDPREDSCDVSILGSLAGNGDGGTVFSSRSMYTTGTNATNWSTSTRRRHRGAAKQRLSETKAENQRPSGWLESIKAAAEKSNCRWDPKLGWIDYVEPKDEERDEPKQRNQSLGRLKTPKFQGARRSKRHDDESSCGDSQSCSTELPFPSKWERAREEMIRNDDGTASAVTEVASNTLIKPIDNRQDVQQTGIDALFELGAVETIVEDAEENCDSDNKSDSHSNPDVSSSSNSSNEKESTEIPEKGKLFEWVGKIEQNGNTKNSVVGEHSEKYVSSINHETMEKRLSSSSVRDVTENIKNSSQESDADEFGQNSGSFDFSATDSAKDVNEDVIENIEDDGFKVIKESRGMGFEQKNKKSSHISQELNEVGEQMSSLVEKYHFKGDKTAFGANRSVMSSDSVSSKAKDWLEKIEKNKNQGAKSNKAMERSKSALFVSAVDDDSTFEYQTSKGAKGEHDTIFDFNEASNSNGYTRKAEEKSAPHFAKSTTKTSALNDSLSGMTSSSDVFESGQKSTNRYGSFLSRLQACTSPMFEDDDRVRSMPQAHLAFMKKSAESQDNRLMNILKNQTLCGNTNNIDESKSGLPPRTPSSLGSGTLGRSKLASNYLEAIQNRSKNGSNFENGDSGDLKSVNSAASTSSSASESWQKFLEKRNKALASSTNTANTNSDVSNNSKAAEEYARSKVQEVIKKISKDKSGEQFDTSRRTQSAARIRPPSSSSGLPPRSLSAGRSRQSSNSHIPSVSRNKNSANDAEDLAAAKVEAMMNMMSNTSMEGEI
jgi:hypothetical protein